MATISVEDSKKLKVSDLKKELKDRGLPVSGTKDVLLERLQAALLGAPISGADEAAEATGTDDQQIDSVEKSIDQLVGDAAPPDEPVQSAAAVTSKENIPKTDDEPEKKVVPLKGMSDAERMKARALKFGGAVSETAKKQMRAERFGIQGAAPTGATGNSSTPADVNKLKQRAERFGMVVSNTLSKSDEEERKRKRLERFGAVTAPSATSAVSNGAKKVKLNSTDSDMEAKKKQRAARFGLTT